MSTLPYLLAVGAVPAWLIDCRDCRGVPATGAGDTAIGDGGPTDVGAALWQPAPGSGWRLTWSDEFEGRPCDPDAGTCPDEATAARVRACFDGPTNVPHSLHGWSTRELLDLPALADLDKCVWNVDHHVNWIHFTNNQNPADLIQMYDPAMVAVSGGELRLGTRYEHGDGPCGAAGEDPTGQDCPYLGAVVTSIPFHGLDHAFPKDAGPYQPGDGLVMPPAGRLALRAKMPAENGNMTALWTWAAGDPFEHEHDILEYFLNWKTAHHQGEVQYHDGASSGHGAWVTSAGDDDARYTQFHTYAMEWSRGESLRFLFDEREVARVDQGDGVLSSGDACWAEEIRGNPFYLILWNLMTTYWYAPDAAPRGPGQMPDWAHVDWVRLYESCASDERGCLEAPNAGTCVSPCAGYGAFDGGACRLGEAPAGTTAAIVSGQLGYRGTNGCPFGGIATGDGCVLGRVPDRRTPRVVGNTYVVDAVCTPGEGVYNCARPCPWPGTSTDATGCRVGSPPAGRPGFVWDNGFYYDAAPSEPRCEAGATFDSAHCFVGPAPAGATAFMAGGDFYLEPDPCAYGGTWDGAAGACRFLTPPAGRTAFLWEGHAYYTAAASTPRCAAGASFDGANCDAGLVPAGADPFIADNAIWLAATCGPVDAFAGATIQPDYRSCDDPTPAR